MNYIILSDRSAERKWILKLTDNGYIPLYTTMNDLEWKQYGEYRGAGFGELKKDFPHWETKEISHEELMLELL